MAGASVGALEPGAAGFPGRGGKHNHEFTRADPRLELPLLLHQCRHQLAIDLLALPLLARIIVGPGRARLAAKASSRQLKFF